jgi:hypothetical protein
LNNGEAKAHAASRCVTAVVYTKEGFEDVREHLVRNAGSIVTHVDNRRTIFFGQHDVDLAARRSPRHEFLIGASSLIQLDRSAPALRPPSAIGGLSAGTTNNCPEIT